MRNEDIRQDLKMFNMHDRLGERQLTEHIQRMPESRIGKQVWKCKPIRHRSVGRLRKLKGWMSGTGDLLRLL